MTALAGRIAPRATQWTNWSHTTMGRSLTRSETAELAESIRRLLADPDAGLTDLVRRRWEGALAALEVVLGERSTLTPGPDL